MTVVFAVLTPSDIAGLVQGAIRRVVYSAPGLTQDIAASISTDWIDGQLTEILRLILPLVRERTSIHYPVRLSESREAIMGVIDNRVVNLDELKLEHFEEGNKFAADFARIGPVLGAKDLGYSYDVVQPGKASCPFHSHRGEEEMFFIVRGSGTLRYGDETRKIRAGDVICCPTGGPETAHQIVNDSDAELAYLSVSTMMPAEICEYPDSKKIGGFAKGLRHMTLRDHHVDYWTGEL